MAVIVVLLKVLLTVIDFLLQVLLTVVDVLLQMLFLALRVHKACQMCSGNTGFQIPVLQCFCILEWLLVVILFFFLVFYACL